MTSQVSQPTRAAASAAAPVSAAGVGARARGEPGLTAWIGLAIVGLGAALVFWVFDALPFQDLPAHAGLIAMRHRFAGSPFEQRFFVLAPHIGPYSLFRFLGEAFVRVIGPVGAVRAIATLPVIATPLALLYARRTLHGDRTPTAGFLGLALAFGLMTLLGFASYLLGVAVMLVGLTLWLDLVARADVAPNAPTTRRRELMMTLFAPLMFVGHGHAFVLFLALAGVACIATGDRLARIVRLRALMPALALAAYVAWLERGSTTPSGSVSVSQGGLVPHFQGAADKLSLLFTPTLLTRSGIDIVAGIVLWAILLGVSIATLRNLRAPQPPSEGTAAVAEVEADTRSRAHSRALYAGAVAIAVLFFALPHAIGWFGFVDGRLVPLFLYLCILGFRWDALGRFGRSSMERGAPAIAATMVVVAMGASYRFQDEAKGFHEVLAQVPREARLLNLPLDPNSATFTAHPFIHYDKLVLAERPIVVSDIWFHQGSALYPTPANPALHLPDSYSESDLHVIDWPAYRLEDWDYVLVRTRPEGFPPPSPAVLELADHRGGWWLYKHR
jgi:hypothetical protein